MPRFDPGNAECFVFTYRAGLLSSLGHDLKLRVTRFSVDVDEGTPAVEARFDPASLRVECEMRRGAEVPDSPKARDRAEIEGNIVRDVLHAARHPEIRFRSTAVFREGNAYRIRGELELHGVAKVLELTAREEGGRRVAEVRLHQPDFDIRPYSALLGAIRLQPQVTVQVSVPIEGAGKR